MRYFGLALGLVMLCHESAQAQQNQQQQPVQPPLGQPESNPRLDMLLQQWEAKMTGIKSLKAQIARESEDKAFHSKELYVGNAYYQSPNLARLELKRYSAELALTLAAQKIQARLTPDTQEKLVQRFLEELDHPAARAQSN